MIKPIFTLNGKVISEPVNWQELAIELNFDKDDPAYRGEVTINEWNLGLGDLLDDNDGTRTANNWIVSGLTGGYGVFEGIPFNIDLKDGSRVDNLFKGYLDLSSADILCSSINAASSESGQVDWLNTVADSFTFEYLYDGISVGDRGKINDSDFVTISTSLIIQVQNIIEKPVELLPFEFGNIITFVLGILNLILLVLAIVRLIIQLVQTLINRLKYHKGMYAYTLCEKACDYLGLEFRSTILDGTFQLPNGTTSPFDQLLILPDTYEQFQKDDVPNSEKATRFAASVLGVQDPRENFANTGFYRGTFGDLLRELKEMFNAKVVINNGVLNLERDDVNLSNGERYQIPNLDRKNVPYRFNADELVSNYNISFTTDANDRTNWQYWKGNEAQIITAPKVINNRLNLIKKEDKRVKLGFARGRRRRESDKGFVEKQVTSFLDNFQLLLQSSDTILAISSRLLIPIISRASSLTNKLKVLGINVGTTDTIPLPVPAANLSDYVQDIRENVILRKEDVLLMERDFVSVPKMLLMRDTFREYDNNKILKLDKLNDSVINSLYLYDNFHYVNGFVGADHNQRKIYTLENVPFCIDDYRKVRNSNIVLDSDGVTEATITSLKWNVYDQKATITYRIKEKYTENLKVDKIETDGR